MKNRIAAISALTPRGNSQTDLIYRGINDETIIHTFVGSDGKEIAGKLKLKINGALEKEEQRVKLEIERALKFIGKDPQLCRDILRQIYPD